MEVSEVFKATLAGDPGLQDHVLTLLNEEREERRKLEEKYEIIQKMLRDYRNSPGVDELVIRLLASQSNNKSSSIDPDELREVLAAVEGVREILTLAIGWEDSECEELPSF